MLKIIEPKNIYKVLASVCILLFILILSPLQMTTNQSIVFGTLLLTVIWWATGYVQKEAASLFMIIVFLIFGQTPIKEVLCFPLSKEFVVIIASFLLSAGIVNSKIADRFSEFILYRFCKNSRHLVMMSFVLGIAFIFIIPQPFPRVIILSSIYMAFLNKQELEEEEKKVILFSIFVASTVTCMIFLNGDIILNYAALKFGDVSMSQLEWVENMSVPSLITTGIILIIFLLSFKQDLNTTFKLQKRTHSKMQSMEKKALIIIICVVIIWLTESLHGISGSYVSIAGVLIMMVLGIVSIRDIRTINFKLLIFLTATFSIGRVLTGSGVAIILSEYITGFFPSQSSLMYIPFIIILIIIVHMILGSTVTTLSVLIPALTGITGDALSSSFIVLLSYVMVSIQYLLPFHHITLMIGYGNSYYENRHILKIGLRLTVAVFGIVFLIYIPWWRLKGLL